MTEMEGGKIEAGRKKELMHGVYSTSKLDTDGSLDFNNTHTNQTHTHTHTHTHCPLVHLVLRKVFIRDIIFMVSEWTSCSEVIRLNQMTSPQAKAQIERKRKGEREREEEGWEGRERKKTEGREANL